MLIKILKIKINYYLMLKVMKVIKKQELLEKEIVIEMQKFDLFDMIQIVLAVINEAKMLINLNLQKSAIYAVVRFITRKLMQLQPFFRS